MTFRMALALLTGLAVTGCIAPYSRVGGTSHRKLYRGDVPVIHAAVKRALDRNGLTPKPHELRKEGAAFDASTHDGPTRKVTLRARPEGLVEVDLDSRMEWRNAITVHQDIAEELGVIDGRLP